MRLRDHIITEPFAMTAPIYRLGFHNRYRDIFSLFLFLLRIVLKQW